MTEGSLRMERGTIVKLSQEGLDHLYKGCPAWREMAKGRRYEFWGYPRDKKEREFGIIKIKRLTSYSFLSINKRFIEPA